MSNSTFFPSTVPSTSLDADNAECHCGELQVAPSASAHRPVSGLDSERHLEGIWSRDEYYLWRSMIFNKYFLYMRCLLSQFLLPYWKNLSQKFSVPDPDPDPRVFWPPGSGSTSQRYGSGSGSPSQRYGSGSFYHHAKIILNPTILRLFLTFYLWKIMWM